ncbi:MAG: GNAT family N-acetyltransferase [Planctomycetota bacterium]
MMLSPQCRCLSREKTSELQACPYRTDGPHVRPNPSFRGRTLIVETKRLHVRRWLPRDLAPLHAIYSDPETVRWCGDGSPLTVAQCREWFSVTENNYRKYGYGMFTVAEKKSDNVVGFAGLVHPGGQEDVEIKYAFDRSRWGQGLASEVVPALLQYGNSSHGIGKIIATVAQENAASQRVLVKSGMSLQASRTENDGSQTLIYCWEVK